LAKNSQKLEKVAIANALQFEGRLTSLQSFWAVPFLLRLSLVHRLLFTGFQSKF